MRVAYLLPRGLSRRYSRIRPARPPGSGAPNVNGSLRPDSIIKPRRPPGTPCGASGTKGIEGTVAAPTYPAPCVKLGVIRGPPDSGHNVFGSDGGSGIGGSDGFSLSDGFPLLNGCGGPKPGKKGAGRSLSKKNQGMFGSRLRRSIRGFEGSRGSKVPSVRATSYSYVGLFL